MTPKKQTPTLTPARRQRMQQQYEKGLRQMKVLLEKITPMAEVLFKNQHA